MVNSQNKVQLRLDAARKDLLDLGLRNSLLNYRLLRARGVEVIDELPAEVFRLLVRECKAMSFLSAPDLVTGANHGSQDTEDEDHVEADSTALLAQPEDAPESGIPAARHRDLYLQTGINSVQLQTRLLNTYYAARTSIEEHGVNILFLALGMLRWYEAAQSKGYHHAPLILIPVTLERSDARHRFQISYTYDDIGENLSLATKLNSEFGITLPPIANTEDLDVNTYFAAVAKVVGDQPRWSVDTTAIALGLFSFGKFLMYRDLDAAAWPGEAQPSAHPILGALLDQGFREPRSPIGDEDLLDPHIEIAHVHQVVDADSSQVLALLDVNRGRNLVIQGPPGSGKSQTITNVIAEALGQGKTVLFVAEKMAALEVVKRRLDKVGLGDACLELHGHKTQKIAVLNQLRSTLALDQPQLTHAGHDLLSLTTTRDRLNDYSAAVNDPIGESGISPYQASGELLRLRTRYCGTGLRRLDLGPMATWTLAEFRQRYALVEEMAIRLAAVGIPTAHPFWGSRRMMLLPATQEWLAEAVPDASRQTSQLRTAATYIAETLGLPIPATRAALIAQLPLAQRVLEAPDVSGVQVQATEWQTHRGSLSALLAAGSRLATLHRRWDSVFVAAVWRLGHVQEVLREAQRQVLAVQAAATRLAAIIGLPPVTTRVAIDAQIRAALRVQGATRLYGVAVAQPEWMTRASEIATLLVAGIRLRTLYEEHAAVFTPAAWHLDLGKMRENLASYHGKWWRMLVGGYRTAWQQLSRACRSQPPTDLDAQLALVEVLQEAQTQQAIIAQHSDLATELFGAQWQGESSDWAQLTEIAGWLRELHQDVADAVLPPALVTYLATNPDRAELIAALESVTTARGLYTDAEAKISDLCRDMPPVDLAEQVELLEELLDAQVQQALIAQHTPLAVRLFGTQWRGEDSDWDQLHPITDWLRRFHADIADQRMPAALLTYLAGHPDRAPLAASVKVIESGLAPQLAAAIAVVTQLDLDLTVRFGPAATWEGMSLLVQDETLQAWATQLDTLYSMVAFNNQAAACREAGLGVIVDAVETWPDATELLVPSFQRSWLESLLERAHHERPALLRFDGDTHHHTILKFRDLDQLHLVHNRAKLAAAHWSRLPQIDGGGQLAILRREFEKKTRHLPIRQLLFKAGNAVQAIKPVFMMSPQSIASFLVPGAVHFDLVVFDEASQVRPVEAFGAIMRGRQTVVVGDSLQLPPTRFFDSLSGAETEDEENVTADLESILGLFVAQGAPERLLRWHYRSRHESLIAVSNAAFYKSRLIVFPSPDAGREELGLRFHHLPETKYDRGSSRTNVGEARAVAQAVLDHARNHSHLTLGVAAFSLPQMQAIQDQLEMLRREDPTAESFFAAHPHEPFFVKNLENVQGDERDVTFISVGYGRTPEGTVAMDFGPLNREGGERRLNVLITRARRRCEIFTNLTADDIDLERSKAHGVRALKQFLRYAQTGLMDVALASERPAGSPFEEEVQAALVAQGYRVSTQVGSAGFFIDLAVVDPRRPGRYLLGIECDGATYHSARSARDRDRLRQQVLEGLGWRIHRVWSTDWFRQPGRELQRLVKAIESAQAASTAPASLSVAAASVPRPPAQRETRIPVHTATSIPRDRSGSAPARAVIPPYRCATLRRAMAGADVAALPTATLAAWVLEIVQVESPVHATEVARRLADAVGVRRMGSRISAAIHQAIWHAESAGQLTERDGFLWINPPRAAVLRDRSRLTGPGRRLELVAPEEIDLAVQRAVTDAYGLERSAIPAAAARLLGFVRVTEEMREQLDARIASLIDSKQIVLQGPHLVINAVPVTASQRARKW